MPRFLIVAPFACRAFAAPAAEFLDDAVVRNSLTDHDGRGDSTCHARRNEGKANERGRGGVGIPEPASPWLNPSESTAGQKGLSRKQPQANESIDPEVSILNGYREYLVKSSSLGNPCRSSTANGRLDLPIRFQKN
jgi:hypothetical protein